MQHIYFWLKSEGILHEILTYINVYICEVGMSLAHPLIFSFDPLEWVNYWNAMRWTYRRLKTNSNREENLTKHVGFVYAYVKKAKIEKLTMIKMATSKKKQDP